MNNILHDIYYFVPYFILDIRKKKYPEKKYPINANE